MIHAALLLLAAPVLAQGTNSVIHEQSCRVEFRVQVPEGTPTLYMPGNLEALGPWDPAGQALEGVGTERALVLHLPRGTDLAYKFTLGSWEREAVDERMAPWPDQRLQVSGDTLVRHAITGFKPDPLVLLADPGGSGIRGRLETWPDRASAFLDEKRHVTVWLPPAYDRDPQRRFPVVYMSDGQNLFDPRLSPTGVDWGVDEAIVAGAEAGGIEAAIVVAVWNTAQRYSEYSPWHEAPAYARFLLEELKPAVDRAFRTRPGPESTFAMGSSMGGLLAWHLALRHPQVFGAAACLSTATIYSPAYHQRRLGQEITAGDRPYLLEDIEQGRLPFHRGRFYFDYGTEGSDLLYHESHARLREHLLARGLEEGRDFVMRRFPGAEHSEAAWRARLDQPLEFLLGRNPPGRP